MGRVFSSHSDSSCSSTREKEKEEGGRGGGREEGRGGDGGGREEGRGGGGREQRDDWFHCHGAKAYSDGVLVQITAPAPTGVANGS